MTYIKMRQNEWEKTVQTAKDKYIAEELGVRPTHRSVSKTLHNKQPISVLEWLGLVLLIFVGIVTAFKMTSVAIPFAYSFYPDAPDIVRNSFAAFMSITFVLFSTTGIVYFKLMDEYDPEIQNQKRKYRALDFDGGWQGAAIGTAIAVGVALWVMQLDLEATSVVGVGTFATLLYLGGLPTNLLQWASPRLYLWLTYLTVGWLVLVSSEGDGSFFARYGVVFAEVALAYLVANLLEKQATWRTTVHEAWLEAVAPYDKRLQDFWDDRYFLRILYRELREALAMLERPHPERKNQRIRPNERLIMFGTAEEVDNILVAEYQRNTGGLRFAEMIKSVDTPSPLQAQVVVKKRKPPSGDREWTVDRLVQDFIIRGLKPSDDYSESQLADDYEAAYNARRAFRAGARKYFDRYDS